MRYVTASWSKFSLNLSTEEVCLLFISEQFQQDEKKVDGFNQPTYSFPLFFLLSKKVFPLLTFPCSSLLIRYGHLAIFARANNQSWCYGKSRKTLHSYIIVYLTTHHSELLTYPQCLCLWVLLTKMCHCYIVKPLSGLRRHLFSRSKKEVTVGVKPCHCQNLSFIYHFETFSQPSR